jgi:hypothetical protein
MMCVLGGVGTNGWDLVSEDWWFLFLGLDILYMLDQVIQLLRRHAQQECVKGTLKR